MNLLVPIVAFVTVVTLIVASWLVFERRRRVRSRLSAADPRMPEAANTILRADSHKAAPRWWSVLSRTAAYERLTCLVEQAGWKRKSFDAFLLMGAFALAGGTVGAVRTGGILWGILSAILGGSLPVFYLLYKRHQDLKRFEGQFPEGLDMISRSVRAGAALSAAIQLVGEDMPDPVGREFRRMSEEIRLGMDPGEALARLGHRVPIGDVAFFSVALRIQRGSGGNLVELLDRLSEVIRERFKLLSHARVLSAQHRWTAICVGLSPLIFAIAFQLLSPGYFNELLTSSVGPVLIAAGSVLEVIGFFLIWRIAKIEV